MRGMTFDHIEVDMRDLFGPSRVYDVLSKVRTLTGIHFLSINYSTIKANADCVLFYQNGQSEWNSCFEKWKGKKGKQLSDVPSTNTFIPSDHIPKSAFNMDGLSSICGYGQLEQVPQKQVVQSRKLTSTKPQISNINDDEDVVDDNDDNDDEDVDDNDDNDHLITERVAKQKHLHLDETNQSSTTKKRRTSESSDGKGNISSASSLSPETPQGTPPDTPPETPHESF